MKRYKQNTKNESIINSDLFRSDLERSMFWKQSKKLSERLARESDSVR